MPVDELEIVKDIQLTAISKVDLTKMAEQELEQQIKDAKAELESRKDQPAEEMFQQAIAALDEDGLNRLTRKIEQHRRNLRAAEQSANNPQPISHAEVRKIAAEAMHRLASIG